MISIFLYGKKNLHCLIFLQIWSRTSSVNGCESLYSTSATLAKSQTRQPPTTGISTHILGPRWLPSQLLNGSYVPGGATTERHLDVGPNLGPTHSDPFIILFSSLLMFRLVSLQQSSGFLSSYMEKKFALHYTSQDLE